MRTSIRPTVAEIDLAAIQRNLARVRAGYRTWGPDLGVVKADAYGHGAVPVARAIEPLCSALAVSLVEEGMELGRRGSGHQSWFSGPTTGRTMTTSWPSGSTPVVYDVGDLERFADAAARRGRRAEIHVKVDTGMSRLGLAVSELSSGAGAHSSAACSCSWQGCAPTSRRRTCLSLGRLGGGDGHF